MSQTVIGMFDNATEAQRAVQELLNKGFTQSNIDISNQNTAATTTGTTYKDEDDYDGIGGFFRSLFSDDDADRYTQVARRSGSIVTVHAQSRDEAERAAEIMDDYGAVDVDERAARYGYSKMTDTDTAERTIPIIEENLAVGKREVETGGARLRSTIVERPVEEKLRLRQERVYVNRTPVDRPASEADFTSFREGQIEVTEHGEIPVVSKEARVVEEVSLGKEVEEREETIRDTVRSTEVEVENMKKTDRTDDDSRLTS
jgi:uncharacterized protein (TIGR02271 family)